MTARERVAHGCPQRGQRRVRLQALDHRIDPLAPVLLEEDLVVALREQLAALRRERLRLGVEHVGVVGDRQLEAGFARPHAVVVLLAIATGEVLLVEVADRIDHRALDHEAESVDEGDAGTLGRGGDARKQRREGIGSRVARKRVRGPADLVAQLGHRLVAGGIRRGPRMPIDGSDSPHSTIRSSQPRVTIVSLLSRTR